MNVHNLSRTNSLAKHFVAELRNVNEQKDRLRFRTNLIRLGELMAYEISKEMPYAAISVETPLGIAETFALEQQPIIATILRAGVPMHQGLLNYFDKADNAFISAYRRHHKDGSFEIQLEYVSCPNLTGRPLILCDPMLATGASAEVALRELFKRGAPSQVHFATIIAANEGVEFLRKQLPSIHIWAWEIDDELTAKSYIVPGLGDAGDLAFGPKMQD